MIPIGRQPRPSPSVEAGQAGPLPGTVILHGRTEDPLSALCSITYFCSRTRRFCCGNGIGMKFHLVGTSRVDKNKNKETRVVFESAWKTEIYGQAYLTEI